MEFMNVGGGELLIIILLALVLFSPEDILKLMRKIGQYARTARQMWSNVSKSLQDDYIPEDVKEVVRETSTTVKEAQSTLTGVRKQLNEITTAVEDDVKDASKIAEGEVTKAVEKINESQSTVGRENTILPPDKGDTPFTADDVKTDTSTAQIESPPHTYDSTDNEVTPRDQALESDDRIPQDELTTNSDSEVDNTFGEALLVDESLLMPDIKDVETIWYFTKDDTTKRQELKNSAFVENVEAKLTKAVDETIKEN